MRWGRPHKYHAKPVTRDGVRFASTMEADWVCSRLHLVKIGAFRIAHLQPTYQLGDIKYRADVEIVDLEGRRWAEDVKGAETPRFCLVRRLWGKYGPHPLRIVKRRGRKWTIEELPGAPS